MNSLVDNWKHRKPVMIWPSAFILAACSGGASSSHSLSIDDIDLGGSTNDNAGGSESSNPTTTFARKGS